jgi:hypothetical protein
MPAKVAESVLAVSVAKDHPNPEIAACLRGPAARPACGLCMPNEGNSSCRHVS